jgi:transcriptional regulator with XRE-family HTH domain
VKIDNLLSDAAVMAELGQRISAARLARGLTQAQFAAAAGMSKRTLERLEDGESTQLGNLVRCLRVLDRLEGFERLLPDAPPNPVDLLKRHGASRQRAAGSRGGAPSQASPATASPTSSWVWGDET